MWNKIFKDKNAEFFTKEKLEVLRKAFDIYVKEECEKIEKEIKDLDEITFSNNFKIKMNTLFRVQAGIENIPHPEADNKCEETRRKIKK